MTAARRTRRFLPARLAALSRAGRVQRILLVLVALLASPGQAQDANPGKVKEQELE